MRRVVLMLTLAATIFVGLTLWSALGWAFGAWLAAVSVVAFTVMQIVPIR
jgi:hypothetical protein